MMNQLLHRPDTAPAPSSVRDVKPSAQGKPTEGRLADGFASHLSAHEILHDSRSEQAKALRTAMQSARDSDAQVLSEKSTSQGAEENEQWLSLVEEWRTLVDDLELISTENDDSLSTGTEAGQAEIEQQLTQLSERLRSALQNELSKFSDSEQPDKAAFLQELTPQELTATVLDALMAIKERPDDGDQELTGDAETDQLYVLLESLNARLTERNQDNMDFLPLDIERLSHLSPQQQEIVAELLEEVALLLQGDQVIHETDTGALYELLEELVQLSAEDSELTTESALTQLTNALAVLERMLEPQMEGDAEQLNQLRELMSELNQIYSSQGHNRLVVLGERQSGNNLPPVAAAFSDVAKQLREQLQQVLSSGSDSTEETAIVDGRVRTTEPMHGSMPVEQRPATLIASQNLTASASIANNTVTALTERNVNEHVQTTRLNASEVARQTQQAIDILGPGASERLRERISVMFNSRTQAAEVRLDPPDLGRLTIRLQVGQDGAAVNFQVSNPQAREAIEQSLSRLRELLHEQGIELADANVSEHGEERNRANSSAAGELGRVADDLDMLEEDTDLTTIDIPAAQNDGRVDYYV